MRALVEAAAFGGAALALHAGALALWHPAAVARGGGTASVAVAAASPEVAALAAAWQAGPDAAGEVVRPDSGQIDGSEAALPVSAPAPRTVDAPAGLTEGTVEPAPQTPDPLPRPPVPAAPAPSRLPAPVSGASRPAPAGDAAMPSVMPPPSNIPPPGPDAMPALPPVRPAAIPTAPSAEPSLASPPVPMTAGAPALAGRADDRPDAGIGSPPGPPDRADSFEVVAAPPVSDLAPPASVRPVAMPDRPAPGQVAAAGETPRAAASGAGGRAGADAPGASGGASQSQQAAAPAGPSAETLQAQWGAQVKGHIAGRTAAPRGARGKVGLVVSVATDGRIAGVGVARSSGNARTDRAAAGAVQRVGRVPRAPGGLPAGTYRFTVALTLR